MTRLLSVAEVLEIHARVLDRTGGGTGVRDVPALESAVAAPRSGFGGRELHADTIAKACALSFSLIANHPFVDGNKRVGLVALDLVLELNSVRLGGDDDEREALILAVASGACTREEFEARVRSMIDDN